MKFFDLTKIIPFFAAIVLCSILIFPPQTFAQSGTQSKAPRTITLIREPPKEQEMPKLFIPGDTTLIVEPAEQISMEFTLEWTNYQAHRVNNNEPFEVILNGTILSNSPEIWTLSTLEPGPGLYANLHFIEDVLGRNGQAYGDNIILFWEISLDGGAFQPMTILPDNSISYVFPSGDHTFQLKISGNMPGSSPDGYYKLQLSHSLFPQL